MNPPTPADLAAKVAELEELHAAAQRLSGPAYLQAVADYRNAWADAFPALAAALRELPRWIPVEQWRAVDGGDVLATVELVDGTRVSTTVWWGGDEWYWRNYRGEAVEVSDIDAKVIAVMPVPKPLPPAPAGGPR